MLVHLLFLTRFLFWYADAIISWYASYAQIWKLYKVCRKDTYSYSISGSTKVRIISSKKRRCYWKQKKNERSRSYEHGLIIPVSNSVYSETRESDHFQSTKFWKICTYTEIPHSDDDGQALSSILNALNETIRPGINFLETLNNQRVDKCSPICISRYARPALLWLRHGIATMPD